MNTRSSILLLPPLLLLQLQVLLLIYSTTPIKAWTPRLSAHSGRFFHAHNNNNNKPGGMKSLKATENKSSEEDNNSDKNDGDTKNSTANEKKKKKTRTFLDQEYLSRLESLYDLDATTSSSSLLESLTDDEVVASTTSPGQSLLYGEKNVVVLGDWMEWEEGGSCIGDYCGDEAEVRFCVRVCIAC
jgi:hypothetical protein